MLEIILLVKGFLPLLEKAETVQAILFLSQSAAAIKVYSFQRNIILRNSTEASRYHVMLITQRYRVEEGNGNLILFFVCIVLLIVYLHQHTHTNFIKSQVIHKHEPLYMSQ
jgi:hypothetical protein